MKIAFSPCPNDTFIFYAWVHGQIPGARPLEVTYADINVTNNLVASSAGPDVAKISYAALPWALDEYALLPCGGALGKGCGPLVLVTKRAGRDKGAASLSGKRIAIPSERSTAYLLFRLWAAQHVPGGVGKMMTMPFQEIMPAVRDGLVDAGLLIHEARFTYPSFGLNLLVDLGNWWEEETRLPIPLGAIVARRSLDLEEVSRCIRASLQYAWAHPEKTEEYVLFHSQELSLEVAKAHIELYVNEYTENIGDVGYKAIEALLSRAAKEGLIPAVDWKKILNS